MTTEIRHTASLEPKINQKRIYLARPMSTYCIPGIELIPFSLRSLGRYFDPVDLDFGKDMGAYCNFAASCDIVIALTCFNYITSGVSLECLAASDNRKEVIYPYKTNKLKKFSIKDTVKYIEEGLHFQERGLFKARKGFMVCSEKVTDRPRSVPVWLRTP
jgi:hypothetical protein